MFLDEAQEFRHSSEIVSWNSGLWGASDLFLESSFEISHSLYIFLNQTFNKLENEDKSRLAWISRNFGSGEH